MEEQAIGTSSIELHSALLGVSCVPQSTLCHPRLCIGRSTSNDTIGSPVSEGKVKSCASASERRAGRLPGSAGRSHGRTRQKAREAGDKSPAASLHASQNVSR